MAATLHGPDGGEVLAAGPTRIVIKATGDDTAGSFFLSETTIPPRFTGPPLHWHERLHDTFYVLEGVLTLHLGEEVEACGPGGFACVPPGVVHTFSNRGEAPVRFLNFTTPSGWEQYMRDLDHAARTGPLTPELIGQVASHYDVRLA